MLALACMRLGCVHSWGPAAVAVSIIPFLPLIDPPVERLLDWVFHHKVPTYMHRGSLWYSVIFYGTKRHPTGGNRHDLLLRSFVSF
jgi:hypothetical protein